MENSGVITLSNFRGGSPLMVSGAGRSGTTAMIRSLGAMGLQTFFGEGSTNAEDEFSAALLAQDENLVATLRETRRQQSMNRLWATKVPCAVVRCASAPSLAAAWNGNWVLVVRDAVATAVRQSLVIDGSVEFGVLARLSETINVVSGGFVLSKHYGVLLVSYEKLLTSPRQVLEKVATWSLVTDPDIAAGVAEVRLGDERYLKSGGEVDK